MSGEMKQDVNSIHSAKRDMKGFASRVCKWLLLIIVMSMALAAVVVVGGYWYCRQEVFESVEPADSAEDLVLAEVPALQDASLSDCQRVELLRHWTAQQIDDAGAQNNCRSSFVGQQCFGWASADRLIAAFRGDKIAVYCGGSAVTLRKLYEDFGYHALEIDMGVQGTFTHMVALVEVECDGRKLLSVQDPYLDTSYRTAYGRLLDYFEMLTLLKQHRHDSVIPTNPEGVIRDSNLGPDPEGGGPKMIRRRMGIEILYTDRRVGKALTGVDCPTEPVYLYLLPFGFYSMSRKDTAAFKSKVHDITGDRPCAPVGSATPDSP